MGLALPGNPLTGKGQAPNAPDYRGAAEATARGNRANQYSPWASSTWQSGAPGQSGSQPSVMDVLNGRSGTPATPGGRDSQTLGLSGPLDAANNSMMSQLQGAWSNPLDNGQQARQHAEDAIYQRATSRLDPMWNQREHSFGVDLANQGIDPNSQAYANAYGNFGRSRNDAYGSAIQDAIMGGGQEAQRQQGMDLQSRMAPLAGMSGIKGLTAMPGAPAGPNYLAAAGMQGQYGLDKTKMDNQFWSDLMNGAGTAAMAAA